MTTNGTGPPLHSVSTAAAIIDTDGRVLAVQRRDNGHWEPPGGVLELHETIEQGLRREVREETGLEVEPLAQTGVYKNVTRGVIALVFHCRVIGGEAATTSEARALRWMTRAEISFNMDQAYAVRLLDALDHAEAGGSSKIRAHDGRDIVAI